MRSPRDTIAAIATPLGQGGLGVIRLSGGAAFPVIQSLFRPLRPVDLTSAPSHTCHVGKLVTPKHHPSPSLSLEGRGIPDPSPNLFLERRGIPDKLPLPSRERVGVRDGFFPDEETIDQVVVTVFRSPHSYTGEDVAEISAHGSPLILNRILQACVAQGARLAGPGEFTERAFLGGKLDLTQAEAVVDLIRARTDAARSAALAQLEGRLAAHVRSLRDKVIPLLAHVEVGLDHSDENHAFISREELAAACAGLRQEVEALLTSARLGKILRDGFRIALVGRPNVGKSSLLNALLKEERAIVTPIPGTTRDTLEESVEWDGLPVVLTDTAGLRADARDPIERLGMDRTRKALGESDVILCVLDASEPLTEEDKRLVRECAARPHLWVANKTDLPRRWEARELQSLNGGSSPVAVSARTGQGLPDLIRGLQELAFSGQEGAAEARWLINVRHQTALQSAQEALSHAAEAATQDAYEECVALELHAALRALGEIIGETVTEDLLDQIFSRFCVGK